MQTQYNVRMSAAIKGMPLLAPRKSRPMQLAKLQQILSLTITAGAGTDDVVLTLVDDKSGQSWVLPTVTGSANEATLGAAIRAAVAADPKFNSLVSVAATQEVSGSDLILAFTARHHNRSYTLSRVGGPDGAAATSTATESQAPGGSGLAFGQLVARSTAADDEFLQMSATTTVSQIAGMLFRSDANHFHALPADFGDEDAADSDLCLRDVHYPIAEQGEFWVEVADAVTPASRVFVRVEGSSVGDWGSAPAGTPQVLTITPAADQGIYGFGYRFRDAQGVVHTRTPIYMPTDAVTTTDDAVDGLEDAAADDAPTGITVSSASAATTLTLTAAAGTEILDVWTQVWYGDTEAVSVAASLSAADVDMLDVSSIARYTSTAAAGGLARVAINMQP